MVGVEVRVLLGDDVGVDVPVCVCDDVYVGVGVAPRDSVEDADGDDELVCEGEPVVPEADGVRVMDAVVEAVADCVGVDDDDGTMGTLYTPRSAAPAFAVASSV